MTEKGAVQINILHQPYLLELHKGKPNEKKINLRKEVNKYPHRTQNADMLIALFFLYFLISSTFMFLVCVEKELLICLTKWFLTVFVRV